jgi:hypothetical protein
MPRNVFTPEQIGPELLATDKRIRAAALRGLRLAARLGEAEVKKEIRGNKPFPIVDLGELLRSPKVSRLEDGALLEVTAPHGTYQEFGTGPAAGNAAFTPPFEAILEWARRKSRGGSKKKRTSRKRRKQGAEDPVQQSLDLSRRMLAQSRKHLAAARNLLETPEKRRAKASKRRAAKAKRAAAREKVARAMAGAVWTSIRRKGVKPKRYYQRASQKFQGHVDKMVARQVAKVRH